MNYRTAFILMISLFVVLNSTCRRGQMKSNPEPPMEIQTPNIEGLEIIGRDIITEVIVRPDSLSDPWEVEKVKGFDGAIMFKTLFEKIYRGDLIVYDCLIDEPLKPDDIKKIENAFQSDMSRIAKIQFLEDWYFNPATNGIIKKIKSVAFGYQVIREGGLPSGYVALFRIKT